MAHAFFLVLSAAALVQLCRAAGAVWCDEVSRLRVRLQPFQRNFSVPEKLQFAYLRFRPASEPSWPSKSTPLKSRQNPRAHQTPHKEE